MARLACQYLRQAGAGPCTIASRTLVNSQVLAEAFDCQAAPIEELDAELAQADLVITATNASRAILSADRLRRTRAARADRPLVVIDLAVPRNVDPDVNELDGVVLYNVDALGQILTENRQQRLSQIQTCEAIVDEEVEAFVQWLELTRVKPLIRMMYSDARQLKDAELTRFFRRHPDLTPEQQEAIGALAEQLVSKFMHPCVSALRQHSASHPMATMLAGGFREIASKGSSASQETQIELAQGFLSAD